MPASSSHFSVWLVVVIVNGCGRECVATQKFSTRFFHDVLFCKDMTYVFLFIQVLSYRCKCWGLLQNACSQLWNVRQKLYEYVMDPESKITDDVLHEITWSAFYFAADTLLDMLLYIKRNKKEASKTRNKVYKPVFVIGWCIYSNRCKARGWFKRLLREIVLLIAVYLT